MCHCSHIMRRTQKLICILVVLLFPLVHFLPQNWSCSLYFAFNRKLQNWTDLPWRARKALVQIRNQMLFVGQGIWTYPWWWSRCEWWTRMGTWKYFILQKLTWPQFPLCWLWSVSSCLSWERIPFPFFFVFSHIQQRNWCTARWFGFLKKRCGASCWEGSGFRVWCATARRVGIFQPLERSSVLGLGRKSSIFKRGLKAEKVMDVSTQ